MEDRIQKLLDLYWEGETTLQEEEEIRQYFQTGNVREEHGVYAPLFHFFRDQAAITSPEMDFEVLENKATSLTSPRMVSIRWIYAAAAILVLALAAIFVFQQPLLQKKESVASVREIEDPEEAYRVTMEALAMVSGKLNKGTQSIQMGLENVHKASIIK